jgi:hypothetical protein
VALVGDRDNVFANDTDDYENGVPIAAPCADVTARGKRRVLRAQIGQQHFINAFAKETK